MWDARFDVNNVEKFLETVDSFLTSCPDLPDVQKKVSQYPAGLPTRFYVYMVAGNRAGARFISLIDTHFRPEDYGDLNG